MPIEVPRQLAATVAFCRLTAARSNSEAGCMQTERLDYADGGVGCEGFVAYEDGAGGRQPGVLVVHSWAGQLEADRETAARLARLGYVGFAIDVYGKGRRGGVWDDNSALMQPFLDDRAMLRRRLLAALTAARAHPRIDPERLAAIGFCFGGLCVLDLARAGAAAPGLRGVVSIHGVFAPPTLEPPGPITAKVLVLHGYDDPMAPPADLLALAREMSAARADWQVHAYGNTMHAFTASGANLPERGIKYSADAARRAWIAMENFFAEIF